MLNKNAYALTIPLYGGADSAIPFPPVCGSADNPPPVLFAKISASVLFRSYSTSPFGNRIWRKKTAHTIKNLPFKNTKPFSRDSVPYPDRGMIPLYPHLQKHFMFLRYRGKGAVPPRQSGGAYLNPTPISSPNLRLCEKSGQGHDALVGVLGYAPPNRCGGCPKGKG